MKKKIQVVFFDAGGTLFQPYPSVGHVYSEVALRHGVAATPEELNQRFYDAWHTRERVVSETRQTSDKIERQWWEHLVRDVFEGLPAFSNFNHFYEELYVHFAKKDCWKLYEDTLPILNGLKEDGYRLAIISNWDLRLFGIVKDLGLNDFFETVIASAAVGTAKPGKAIFEEALRQMKVTASECLHVGDSLHDDYLGAHAVGIKPVLLDRHGKAYNEVHAIADFHQLRDHLK